MLSNHYFNLALDAPTSPVPVLHDACHPSSEKQQVIEDDIVIF